MSIFMAMLMTLSSVFTVDLKKLPQLLPTGMLHHRHGQLDVCEQAQVKYGQDGAEWAGTRYNMSMLNDSGPSLQLNNVTVMASQHVRMLRVHLSSELSLDKHVSGVSVTCFYHLRQLRRIRRSLDADSAATLDHTFVTSRVDYCNAVLAAAPKTTTDRLQRVLNAAARVVSDTKTFDQGLS